MARRSREEVNQGIYDAGTMDRIAREFNRAEMRRLDEHMDFLDAARMAAHERSASEFAQAEMRRLEAHTQAAKTAAAARLDLARKYGGEMVETEHRVALLLAQCQSDLTDKTKQAADEHRRATAQAVAVAALGMMARDRGAATARLGKEQVVSKMPMKESAEEGATIAGGGKRSPVHDEVRAAAEAVGRSGADRWGVRDSALAAAVAAAGEDDRGAALAGERARSREAALKLLVEARADELRLENLQRVAGAVDRLRAKALHPDQLDEYGELERGGDASDLVAGRVAAARERVRALAELAGPDEAKAEAERAMFGLGVGQSLEDVDRTTERPGDGGDRQRFVESAARQAEAGRVWQDALAGQRPGLLRGLSAADVPLKSIDEQPMRGSDYVPPEAHPRAAAERPDKAALEAAAVLAAVRDERLRPRFADVSRGQSTGCQLTGGLDSIGPKFALEPKYPDPALAHQAAVGDEWRRWRGAGLGREAVNAELARQGLASAGGSADGVWLDVMAARPPGLLGGLAAGEVPMKPAAVAAPPAAGAATAAAADGAVASLQKLQKAAEDLAARLGMIGGPVPPALPSRPGGGSGRLWSGE